MGNQNKVEILVDKMVKLIVKEHPSYHEAKSALQIAGMQLENVTYPAFCPQRDVSDTPQ